VIASKKSGFEIIVRKPYALARCSAEKFPESETHSKFSKMAAKFCLDVSIALARTSRRVGQSGLMLTDWCDSPILSTEFVNAAFTFGELLTKTPIS